MSAESIIIIFVLITFVFLLSGIPVAFVLASTSLIFASLGVLFGFFDYSFLLAIPNRIYGIMTNQNLLAVPLFIFMGLILEKTKIAENLLTSMNIFYKNTSGGFAISVVIVGALMAASTGIVGASVVTLGLLSLPVMIKNGYPPSIACGTICASGTLGQIIPPSLVLILLADVLSSAYQQAQLNAGIFAPETVTISDLFAGAIIPGLLLPIMYILYIKFQKIECSEEYSNDEYIQTENLSLYKYFIPPILLILIVLGSIIFGIATPSEASALGAAGAFFLALSQKRISKIIINTTAKETIKLTSMVFMILIGATFFSLVFRGLDGEAFIHNLLLVDANDKNFSLIIVLLLMFFLGFILDFIEIIFIIIPLFGPALFSLGFEPIWIGILIAMVLQTSFLTPPMAMAAYYLKGVAGDSIELIEIFKSIMPYLAIVIFTMVLMYNFPQIALFLPDYFFGIGK